MEVTQGAPFESFGLSEATMRAIRNKEYEISTPVQAGCIPPMLEGKDVIAKAPTGTGKTMAFGIPIIERIDPESEAVQAVILAPHISYRYGNPDGIYMDDWLHFETTDEACTRRLNAMSNRPFPIGNHRLYTFCIQQILWEQSYGDPAAAQENTDALFVLLLNHLNEAFRKQAVRQARNPFQERLQLLRLEMENTSQEPHTAAELAQRLNISEEDGVS